MGDNRPSFTEQIRSAGTPQELLVLRGQIRSFTHARCGSGHDSSGRCRSSNRKKVQALIDDRATFLAGAQNNAARGLLAALAAEPAAAVKQSLPPLVLLLVLAAAAYALM